MFPLRSGYDGSKAAAKSSTKGSPEERSAEELASHAFGRIHLQNLREEYSVLLYEEDGVLYYLDPAEETVYRSALTVDQLRAFLAA